MRNCRFLLFFAITASCFAQARDVEFNKLADRVFDQLIFRYDPVQGTAAGFHQYDTLMPTGSRPEIDEETSVTKKFIEEVQNFDPTGLSPYITADRELMLSQLHSQLLA